MGLGGNLKKSYGEASNLRTIAAKISRDLHDNYRSKDIAKSSKIARIVLYKVLSSRRKAKKNSESIKNLQILSQDFWTYEDLRDVCVNVTETQIAQYDCINCSVTTCNYM